MNIICERCDELEYSEEVVEDFNDQVKGDKGEHLTCVIHHIYLAPKTVDNNLFRTRATVANKVVSVIDTGRTDNLISSKASLTLKLPQENHPRPYLCTGWVGLATMMLLRWYRSA